MFLCVLNVCLLREYDIDWKWKICSGVIDCYWVLWDLVNVLGLKGIVVFYGSLWVVVKLDCGYVDGVWLILLLECGDEF